MLFEKQLNFIDAMERELFLSFKEAIQKNENVIKDFIVEKQLFKEGIDGEGNKLKGYVRTTINYKIRKGQPFDRTTLRDSGDFHASITIDARDTEFEIKGNVPHTKYLVKRYGENILLPSLENMLTFFDLYYSPSLKKKLDDQFTR